MYLAIGLVVACAAIVYAALIIGGQYDDMIEEIGEGGASPESRWP
jgi:hypothetical protein